MKKIFLISIFALALTASCKKSETKPEPTPESTPTPITVTPASTVGVSFFVDANSYEVKEPFDYPNGSSKITQSFTALGTQSICTAPGTKLSIKYKDKNNTDTTKCNYYFYKNSTYVGTCELIILKSGKTILNSAMPFSTYMDSSCVTRAVVFN